MEQPPFTTACTVLEEVHDLNPLRDHNITTKIYSSLAKINSACNPRDCLPGFKERSCKDKTRCITAHAVNLTVLEVSSSEDNQGLLKYQPSSAVLGNTEHKELK